MSKCWEAGKGSGRNPFQGKHGVRGEGAMDMSLYQLFQFCRFPSERIQRRCGYLYDIIHVFEM